MTNNVSIADWETCRGLHPLCPLKCLEIQDPVCGDDNNLYPNLCVMHRQNCGKMISSQPLKYCFARAREFRSFDPCPSKCLDVYKPVCGSNGIVYLNECYLRKHTCGQDVEMVKISQCVLVRKCPQVCVALYDPVCGSDGKMYLNHCRMLKDNCGKEIKRMSRKFCSKKESNLSS
ncbi:four-domain proteases inhibitor-like [Centruroides sculpturatus]|uniref:four-domain proteases inhibitor-like n=1 Tax=Centruroides sculpturatus TaxID=218467 RepID=UPI000C6E6B6D|nr:four-domain proteases inhibitor-like [Centruroides sculpturatus]